jgi:hypothetical protein
MAILQQLVLSRSVLRHRREDIDARLRVHFYNAEEMPRYLKDLALFRLTSRESGAMALSE